VKVYGLVLAGGRSSRFGREKAAAEVAGRPMMAWVLDVLTRGCVEVAVNAGPGTRASAYGDGAGHVILADDPSDPPGPLAGVRAGLVWAKGQGADALATAPCDTPFLPADLVAGLLEGWTPGDSARVAISSAGPAPLCALWPIPAALDLIAETLAAGSHPSIRRVLEALRAVEVEFPDPRAFTNLNTVADYTAAISGRARPE
jgi:molybdopterin-guanine dinucleotide biosynthesis protein A